MLALPKLALIILVVAAVWFAVRWLNRLPAKSPPPRPAAPRAPGSPPAAPAEDLVLCGVCRAYVAAGAPGCAKAGCPHPR